MATALKKLATRRLTSVGIQYSVDDRMGHHVVTVGPDGTFCSCGVLCKNVGTAERKEAQYREPVNPSCMICGREMASSKNAVCGRCSDF